MSVVGILIILYVAGLIALVADIFLPSHLLLTAIGLGLIGYAIHRTFQLSHTAGWVGLGSCVVVYPTLAYIGVKNWYRTPFGKKIAPPNPTLTVADYGIDVAELTSLVGQTGRTVSTLRPSGICDFSGKRLSCVAESGLIEAGVEVSGVGIRGGNLLVRPTSI